MQFDFFNAGAEPAIKPEIELLAHQSADYAPRTSENARSADVTVAFATDFDTAGERLTARMAGRQKYVGIPYGTDVKQAGDTLVAFLMKTKGSTLNVAGNGIYTLIKQRVTQEAANAWVLAVLQHVVAQTPITHIRSGGQTGIDEAGLVAGLAMGIPVTGLYPKGFKRRLQNGADVTGTAEALEIELRGYAGKLKE